MECLRPDLRVDFHTFDHPPESSNPDAFERTCDRIATLSSLLDLSRRGSAYGELVLIATTPDALLSPCPILEERSQSELTLAPGTRLDFEEFCSALGEKLGYSSEILCEEPGQFAVRGGLVDVYPVNGREPVRIDFFGDEVEEVRAFDPTSQRTNAKVSSLTISSSETSE